jgi:hypothetical protein
LPHRRGPHQFALLDAFVRRAAKPKTLSIAKSVMVANIAVPINNGGFLLYSGNLLKGKGTLEFGSQSQFSRGEHSTKTSYPWFSAAASVGEKRSIEWNYTRQDLRESDVIGWRKPVIFPGEINSKFLGLGAKIVNVARNDADISSQLPALRVPSGFQLLVAVPNLGPTSLDLAQGGEEQSCSQESIEEQSYRDDYLNYKSFGVAIGLVVVLCIVAFYEGSKRLLYRSKLTGNSGKIPSHCGQWSGIAIIGVAWITGATAMWLLVGWSSGQTVFPSFISEEAASDGSACPSA